MTKFDLMIHKLNKAFGRMSAEREKNKLTRLLYSVLYSLKVIRLKHYLFSLRYYRNPTREMRDQKRFFSEHAGELKAAYDFLEDDKSRAVFENILKYRVTSDWTYLKRSKAKDTIKTQYLAPELPFSEHEIIVDCGAYTGDTAKRFYKKIPGCRVIALEPDDKNYETLRKLRLEGLKPIKAAAWSGDTVLSFSSQSGGTRGAVSASGTARITAAALDHLAECQSATYIKMDIEGAELEALKGAEKIIKNRRPKLAVCIYHHPRDFFEIPLYIKSLNPDYKLFVHHHGDYTSETVLYAV